MLRNVHAKGSEERQQCWFNFEKKSGVDFGSKTSYKNNFIFLTL